jgi:O-antigen/teichoic acid export membrane protein
LGIVERFGSGLVWNYPSKISEFILKFLSLLVIARYLGPSQYGVYSALMGIFTLATLFGSLGFGHTLLAYIPKLWGEEPSKASFLLRRLFGLGTAIAVAVSLVLYLSASPLAMLLGIPEAAAYIKFVLPYIGLFLVSDIFIHFLLGRLEVKPVAVVRVAVQLGNLALAILLARLGYGIKEFLYILILTSGMGFVIYLLHVRRVLFLRPSPFGMGRIYRFAVTVWLADLVNYVLGRQSDILLIGYFLRNPDEIGQYSAASTLAMAVSTALVIGLDGVLLPVFAEVQAQQGNERVGEIWRMALKLVTFASLPALLFCAFYPKIIVIAFYREAYLPSVILFQVAVTLAAAGRTLGGGINSGALYALNREQVSLYIRASTAVLNLILAILLIPHYRALGAIIATGIAALVTMLAETLAVGRFTKGRYPSVFTGKVVLASIFGLAVTLILRVESLLTLLAAAFLYMALVVGVLYLLKPLEERDKAVLARMHPFLANLLSRF